MKWITKLVTVPVYKKEHIYWNAEQQKWLMIPKHEINRTFSIDKLLNTFVLLMFVSTAIWLMK